MAKGHQKKKHFTPRQAHRHKQMENYRMKTIPEKISVLNIRVNNLTMDELLSKLDQGMVVTPNIDHFIKLQKDKIFYHTYQQADYTLLDSRVVYYMLRLFGCPIKGVIPGSDLLPAFCRYHRDNPDIKIFLLGSMNGIAHQAMTRINEKAKRAMVVDACSPSRGFDTQKAECRSIVEKINRSGANVLVVGVGAPKQELWLAKHLPETPNIKIAMALGATIDFEAGFRRRPHRYIQKVGMEWFFRFLSEPGRLWKRYFVDDVPFFWLFLKQRAGVYRNPFDHSALARTNKMTNPGNSEIKTSKPVEHKKIKIQDLH